MPNYSLLPELRRKRVVLLDRLSVLRSALEATQRQFDELDRQIAENDYYHPPPRPTT